MAVVADLTPTPVPASSTLGGVPIVLYHCTITPAGGAGTYTFSHGLQYTPTFALAIARLAEGTAPSATNSLVAACIVDFSATKVAINVAGNATYDVIYG